MKTDIELLEILKEQFIKLKWSCLCSVRSTLEGNGLTTMEEENRIGLVLIPMMKPKDGHKGMYYFKPFDIDSRTKAIDKLILEIKK